MKELDDDDYILTNLDINTGCFTIRLKDNNEYIVYRKKGYDFIIKDNQKIRLSNKVRKAHIESVRQYQVSGI